VCSPAAERGGSVLNQRGTAAMLAAGLVLRGLGVLRRTSGDGKRLRRRGLARRNSLRRRLLDGVPVRHHGKRTARLRAPAAALRSKGRGEVKRGGGGVRARRGSGPAFYRHGPLGLRGAHAEGGGGIGREDSASDGRWSWPGPRLGRSGLSRAHGLGPIREDKISFFPNYFSAKQIPEKY
jgi:hypothetical protein